MRALMVSTRFCAINGSKALMVSMASTSVERRRRTIRLRTSVTLGILGSRPRPRQRALLSTRTSEDRAAARGGLAAAAEVVERARDPQHFVHGPGRAADGHHKQLAGDAGRARLRRAGGEGEAPRRVAIGEGREHPRGTVTAHHVDLAALTVVDEDVTVRG